MTDAVYMLDDMLSVAFEGGAILQGVATMDGTSTFTIAGGTTFPRPLVEIAFATDPTNEIPTWTDVTEYVQQFSIRRGRQRELDVIEPGTASFMLDNEDRRFDPTNTAGPYYPNILPVRRIRVRAIWNNVIYNVFSGYAHGWPQDYPNHFRNTVSLEAVDALGFLSFADLTLSRVSEVSGSRVSAILNAANWPASDRAIDTGQETLAATTEENGSALSLLQDIAATELGRLFADKSGKITFQGRDRIVTTPPASKSTWNDDAWDPSGAHTVSFDGSGSVTFNSDDTITVSDGGSGDFWSTADTGTMLWRDIPVPGSIEVTVTSDLNSTESNLRFLGLRSSSAADAAMFVLLTDADGSHFSTVWRDTVGGTAGYQGENVGPAYNDTLPVRCKITYDGTTARAYVSQAGAPFSLINSRAIAVPLDVAFLANGGGAGTHVPTTYRVSYLYDDLTPNQDEGEIYNRVTMTTRGGTPQTAQDTTSQAQYFIRDYSQSDLALLTDADALARAQFILGLKKDPLLRFDSMEVDGRADNSFAALLDLEIGDRVLVERFSTSMISRDVFVDGIETDVNRDDKSWIMNFSLTPVPPTTSYWIAGTSTLGTDTVLGF